MESKKIIMLFAVVGSMAGGYLPSLWGAGGLSMTSVIFTAIGGFLGIYIGFRLSQ